VNNILFTAANDYDYYATAYDFITDNLDDTISGSVESSSVSSLLSYMDVPPFIPIQPSAISFKQAAKSEIQDTFPFEPFIEEYPLVLDFIKANKTESRSEILPNSNSIRSEVSYTISSQSIFGPVSIHSSQATQIMKDPIMSSLQRFSGNDVTETTPLGRMIKQTPTSSIIPMPSDSFMSNEDPFGAFFGGGPAIPQWVLDMLGSVHESPKTSAHYHFRH
jgi:hypothetical protein